MESTAITPMGVSSVLFLIGTDVSSAIRDGQLHVKLGVRASVQMRDLQLRINNLNVGIHLNVSSRHNALALKLDISDLRVICGAVVADGEILDVHNDLGHILFHTRNRTEFVQNSVDFYLAYR